MQVAVPHVVPDGELVLSHLRQHRSRGMPESMPTHTRDTDSPERRLDLLLEYRRQVQRVAALQPLRSEDVIPRLVVKA